MIRGVIFDLDGVLVSTDELHYQSWQKLADEEGIPFDRTVNDRLRGVSRMVSLEIVLEKADRSYTPAEKAEMAERKNATYRDLLQRLAAGDLLPGVAELLEELRERGVKVAVASSSKNATLIMAQVGLADRFDAVVDGNDIQRSKPDPEVFLLAAERLGLPAGACLVVEDAASGVEAARRAGMAILGVAEEGRLPGAERVVHDLSAVTAEALLGG